MVILLTVFLRANRSDSKKNVHCIRYDQGIKIGRCLLKIKYAHTHEEQLKGLGGRKSLPKDEGLLFVFVSQGKQCFWMKDMQFPIDMIWINSDKKIVYVEKNVSPNTFPQIFCPEANGQYVLETNAGIADKLKLVPNQYLLF